MSKAFESNKNIKIPSFPPKFFIGNTRTENIEKRKGDLQNYLDDLLKSNVLQNSEDYNDFLDNIFSKFLQSTNIAKDNDITMEKDKNSLFNNEV